MNQAWAQTWQDGEFDFADEAVDWMRERLDSVKALMRKFPPSCLVRSIKGESHFIPAPGTFGVLCSYIEPGDSCPNGEITVTQHPNSNLRAGCDPNKLEVVGYWKGLTPEIVAAVLEGI